MAASAAIVPRRKRPHLIAQGNPKMEVGMSFRSRVLAAGLIGGSLLVAAPSQAADPAPKSGESCFPASDWQGWKSPSPDVIYIRVRASAVYRLNLSAGSWSLQDPGVHLVNVVRGSDWLCGPLDFDLELRDDHGVMRQPLIVRSMERLTPDEVKAIPAKFRP